MITDRPISNIFQPRNDYYLRSFNCKKYLRDPEDRLRQIIIKTWGHDPYFRTQSRRRELVIARQIHMTICYTHLKKTYASAGILVGKDHATTIHAITAIHNECETNDKFKELYQSILIEAKRLKLF